MIRTVTTKNTWLDRPVKEVGGVKVVETHPGGIRPVGRVVADHAYPQGCVFRTWIGDKKV